MDALAHVTSISQLRRAIAPYDEETISDAIFMQGLRRRQQMEEWQQQRVQNKELSRTWEDFRQHVLALGAPDPGPEAPQEFYFKLHSQWTTATPGTARSQISLSQRRSIRV